MIWNLFKRKKSQTIKRDSIFILKVKIDEFTRYGMNDYLRKGTAHFLPNTEAMLCHYYPSQISFDPKIWIRGTHRCGYLKTRPTKLEYISKMWIDEIVNPTSKTIHFLKVNGISNFSATDNFNEADIVKLLAIYNDRNDPIIESGEISDELHSNCIKYLEELINLIETNQIDAIIKNHMKFPIIINYLGKNDILEISEQEFRKRFLKSFKETILQSVLNSNLDTIYAEYTRLIIGRLEFTVSKNYVYKMTKIEMKNGD